MNNLVHLNIRTEGIAPQVMRFILKNKAAILILLIFITCIYIIYKHFNRKEVSQELLEENRNSSSPEYSEERSQNEIENKKKVKKLPSIAILGVKKCGTIALSNMLKMHPNLETPGNPEIFFWMMPKLWAKGLDYYKAR